MSLLKTAIIGASGYSGEELLRLLFRHPAVELTVVTSRQYAGLGIGEVFPRFSDSDLKFSAPDVDLIAENCELVFLALPHGLAAEYAIPLLEKQVKVIDISADFRLKSVEKYRTYYKAEHPAPDLLQDAVYGLPELYRDRLRHADLIAAPGCYCTSIILPCAPLLSDGLVKTENIICSCLSGVSGAGRKVDLPFIFPECNESVKAYSITGHRHLPEIEQELALAAGVEDLCINFVPHLVPVNRGIISTIFFDVQDGYSGEKALASLRSFYRNEPFVRVLDAGKLPDTKHITSTNVCEIGCAFDEHTGKLIVISAIDNLTKGAAGQAVQDMNIRFGFEESQGLLG